MSFQDMTEEKRVIIILVKSLNRTSAVFTMNSGKQRPTILCSTKMIKDKIRISGCFIFAFCKHFEPKRGK